MALKRIRRAQADTAMVGIATIRLLCKLDVDVTYQNALLKWLGRIADGS